MSGPPVPRSNTLSGLLWGAVAFVIVFQILGAFSPPVPVEVAPKSPASPSSSIMPPASRSDRDLSENPLDVEVRHPDGSWILEDATRSLRFSARGASLSGVTLKINETAAIRGEPHELFGEFNPDQPHFCTHLDGADALSTLNWALVSQTPDSISFEVDPAPGVHLTKTYRLGTNYLVHVEVEASAADGRELEIFQYGACGLEPEALSGLGSTTFSLKGFFMFRRERGTLAIRDFDFGDLEDGEIWSDHAEQGLPGLPLVWCGHGNNYFLTLLGVGDEAGKGSLGVVSRSGEDSPSGLQAGLWSSGAGRASLICDAYLGPRYSLVLEAVDPQLTQIFEISKLSFIESPLLWILDLLQSLVHNYGLAIILLTLVVRVAIHPLSRRGQIKMAHYQEKIRQIQPKLEQLKKKHGKDRQAFAQAQMKLMRDNNISGGMMLGGCLPMLMQMPIFLGLYYMLQENIELRGAHFLWIQDLSLSDRLVPDLGFWPGALNILPLLTLAVTIIQMKRSMGRNAGNLTPEQAASQKAMLFIMPAFMLMFTYSFPAGLLLYWFTSALFGILEAEILRRKIDVLKSKGKFQ